MGRFTQIPESAFKEMQFNAGVLLRTFDPTGTTPMANSDIICATTGGISASCVPAYSDMGEDVDNCPANMMELKNLDSWDVKMSFTALAFTAAMLKLALGAADIDAGTSKITPRRDLKDTDFSDLWWVGDRTDGGYVAVQLKNALSTGGLSMQTTKAGKGNLSVELTGHVSIEEQNVVPMAFYVEEGEPEE